MINYNEIKEKYPKSFDALIDFMLDHERHSGDTGYEISKTGKLQSLHAYPEFHNDPIVFNDRDLYDFFDWEELFLFVGDGYGSFGEYNNRRDAETAAFTTAFDVLEKRLKK